MGEEHRVAIDQVRRDVRLVDGRLLGVGQKDHHEVGLGDGIGHSQHAQARRLCF